MSDRHATGIVWFRRDLRLADNPALRAALSHCERLVLLYIDDTDEDDDALERDRWAPGAASRWWLHQSLSALSEAIADKGASLTIRRGAALEVLREIVGETGAAAVHWNRLYEPAAIDRDKRVKAALQADGLEVQSHNGALLIEPWEVMTKSGTPYRVFTPFWRAARAELQLDDPLPTPRSLDGCGDDIDSLQLDTLGLEPTRDWDEGLAEAWTPGEAAAMSRAKAFIESPVYDYDDKRDLPSEPGTSRLSPHLHHGEISPRQVWRLVEEHQDPEADGCRVFLSELGWREFSHYVLYHFPHTTNAPMNEKFAEFPWRDDADDDIRAWERGRTGIPIVDAGMRQLWRTGWMHNRVRMIVASLLVKNIGAHWLHGARWFWDTLVDADLPANTMGWQWSAGTGADAAPYFRIFNPVTQGEKFDGGGDYVRRWVPEIAELPNKYLHKPWEAPGDVLEKAGIRLGEDYPEPIVDLKTSRKRALDAFQTLKEAG